MKRTFGGWQHRPHLEERAMDAILDFGVFLPLTLTQDSKSAAVRLGGLACFCVWCLPVFALFMLPMLFLIFVNIVGDVARGEN